MQNSDRAYSLGIFLEGVGDIVSNMKMLSKARRKKLDEQPKECLEIGELYLKS